MKIIATLIAITATALCCRAEDVTIDQKTAQTMKTVSCNDFESQAHVLENQIVKIKFSYRDASVRKLENGDYGAQLQMYLDSSRKKKTDAGWGFVDARVPKEGLAWINKVPTNIDTRSTLFVFGRVVANTSGGFFLQVLGKDLKTDMKGSKITW